MLAPFPVVIPRHGGQVRTATTARALSRAGWRVDVVGLYHADFYPAVERGVLDIVISDPVVSRRATDDVLFGDLHVARAAAGDSRVVDQLRMLLARLRPDVVQVEHPWSWLVLRTALPRKGGPKVVYSSHNIEWNLRLPLLGLNLNRPGSDRLMEATRLLEREVARAADVTLSISDIEGARIQQFSFYQTGRFSRLLPQ
jgi:hypothetical protein